MGISSALKAVWIPRILSGLLIVFFLVMSLDVFNGSKPIGDEFFAFLMQSLPAIALGIALALSWRFPQIAGGLFLALAVCFTLFFGTYRSPAGFIVLSLVPAVIGLWFLAASAKRL